MDVLLVRVPAMDRSRFEAYIRAEGFADFAIWQQMADGQRGPAANRSEYYPLVRTTVAGNRSSLGFDLGSAPKRRTALKVAMESGLVTCTTAIRDARDPEQSSFIQIYRPVFSQDGASRPRGVALADLQPGPLLNIAHPRKLCFLNWEWALPKRKSNSSPFPGHPPATRIVGSS